MNAALTAILLCLSPLILTACNRGDEPIGPVERTRPVGSVERIRMANLGITQEWLDANAEVAIEAYVNNRNPSITPNRRALHLSSFKDLKIIEKVLLRRFNIKWTDDYPSAEIEITETDGRAIKVSSKTQHLFMLPWTISGDGKELKTYNADISRAVASLTPEDFANKERLAGPCSDSKLFWISSAASRVAPNYFADKERLAGACLAFDLADMVADEIKGR
jgi:hypothetical protein